MQKRFLHNMKFFFLNTNNFRQSKLAEGSPYNIHLWKKTERVEKNQFQFVFDLHEASWGTRKLPEKNNWVHCFGFKVWKS